MVHTKPCTSKPFGLSERTVFFFAESLRNCQAWHDFSARVCCLVCCHSYLLSCQFGIRKAHSLSTTVAQPAEGLVHICHSAKLSMPLGIQLYSFNFKKMYSNCFNQATTDHTQHKQNNKYTQISQKKNLNVHECMTSDQNGT